MLVWSVIALVTIVRIPGVDSSSISDGSSHNDISPTSSDSSTGYLGIFCSLQMDCTETGLSCVDVAGVGLCLPGYGGYSSSYTQSPWSVSDSDSVYSIWDGPSSKSISYSDSVYSSWDGPSQWSISYSDSVYSSWDGPSPWSISYSDSVYSSWDGPSQWSISYSDSVYSSWDTPSSESISYSDSVYSSWYTPSSESISYSDSAYSGWYTHSSESISYSDSSYSSWDTQSSESISYSDSAYSGWYTHSSESISYSDSAYSSWYTHSSESISYSDSVYSSWDAQSSESISYSDSVYSSWDGPSSESISYSSRYDDSSSLWTSFDSISSYDGSSSADISPTPTDWLVSSSWTSGSISSSSSSYYYVPSFDFTGLSLDTIVRRDGNDIPRAAVKCNFTAETGYRYQIVIRTLSGQSLVSSGKLYADEVADYFMWVEDIYGSVVGFGLEQSYNCSVTVFDLSGNIQEFGPVYSSTVSPVTFNTTVEFDRSGYGYFWVYLNLPFTCPDQEICTLHVKLYDTNQNYGCYDAQIAFVGDTCGLRFNWSSAVSEIPNEQNVGYVHAKLASKNSQKYYLSDSFTLRMVFETEGEGSENWWSGEFSTDIQVSVRDDDTYWKHALCYIENDPRVRTFDNVYYNLLEYSSETPKVYVAVKHTTLPVQIQVLTEGCVWGGACSCGVIVQAGRDVFMADHCYGSHKTTFLSNEDNVLEVWMIRSNVLMIYLPHGMAIRVTISNPNWFWWFSFTLVNIQIYPTPFDMGKIDGLCGNFDGMWLDDFMHAYSWYFNGVDDFIPAWDVTETSDSLYRLDFSDLQTYTYDDMRCVCMGSHGEGEATCSVKETATCTYSYRYGYKLELGSLSSRKRRSAGTSAGRDKRWLDFTQNFELAEAMKADTEFTFRKSRVRRSQPKTVRVKRQEADLNYTEMCEQHMNIYCAGLLNSADVDVFVNITARIENCVSDSTINPENVLGWAMTACEGMRATTEDIIAKDEESMDPSVVELITTSSLCPGDCGGHGTCGVDENCVCDSNYGLSDCTFDTTIAASILEITGDGICNRATHTCLFILVVTDGIVDNCMCRIEHTIIAIDGNQRSLGTQTVPAIVISIFEAYCPVPDSSKKRRRRRSASGNSATLEVADAYSISVSNDGSTFSNSSSVVSLDTTCLTYNITDNTVTLDPEYCIIDGVCYGNYTIPAGLNCTYCDVTNDRFDWTTHSGQCLIDGECYAGDSCSPDEDEGLATYAIVLMAIFIPIGVAGLAGLVFFLVKKYFANRHMGTARIEGLYPSVPANQKFKLRPETPGNAFWAQRVDHTEPSAWLSRPKPGAENIPDNLYEDCEAGPDDSVPAPTFPDGTNSSPGASTSRSIPD